MSTCGICGRDHKADKLHGVELYRHSRAEREGPPFDTIVGDIVLGDMVELRAKQTDDGAWEAIVYVADYEALAECEVGRNEFVGYAATRARAEQLARDFSVTLLRRFERARAEWASR